MAGTENLKDLWPDRQGFSFAELARAWGVSEEFLRLENKRGNLKALRFGRRLVVSRGQLAAYLERAESADGR